VLGPGADGTGYNFAAEPLLASAGGGNGPADGNPADAPAYAGDMPRDVFFSRTAPDDFGTPDRPGLLAGRPTDLSRDMYGDAFVDLASAVPLPAAGSAHAILDSDGFSFQDRYRYFIALAALTGIAILNEGKAHVGSL